MTHAVSARRLEVDAGGGDDHGRPIAEGHLAAETSSGALRSPVRDRPRGARQGSTRAHGHSIGIGTRPTGPYTARLPRAQRDAVGEGVVAGVGAVAAVHTGQAVRALLRQTSRSPLPMYHSPTGLPVQQPNVHGLADEWHLGAGLAAYLQPGVPLAQCRNGSGWLGGGFVTWSSRVRVCWVARVALPARSTALWRRGLPASWPSTTKVSPRRRIRTLRARRPLRRVRILR
jgi:hypothetical protein